MRRTDREMNRDFALQVVDKAVYCVISVLDTEGNPYGFPISHVRKDDQIFIHSAKKGKKVEIFAQNQVVSVTCVGESKVPDLFDEETLDSFVKNPKGVFGSKVFTTEYESAIIKGQVSLVEDKDAKIESLRLLCEKYTPDKMKYFDLAIAASLAATNIYAIQIDEITGKRKKFDSHGDEMTHGRME